MILKLCEIFAYRLNEEKEPHCYVLDDHRLDIKLCERFVRAMKPVVFLAQFSKSQNMVTSAAWAMRHLAYICPELILPPLIERVFPALETLTETHQTVSSISALTSVARPLFSHDLGFPSGAKHLLALLNLTLPGIDPNDASKTAITLQFLASVFVSVPLIDCSSKASAAKDEVTREIYLSTGLLEDWLLQFLDRVFGLLESMLPASSKRHTTERGMSKMVMKASNDLFQALSPELLGVAHRKLRSWVSNHVLCSVTKTAGKMCASACFASPVPGLKALLAPLLVDVTELLAGESTVDDITEEDDDDDTANDQILWNLGK